LGKAQRSLHPAQWRLLRAVVAPGPDDRFVVGDPHQRIYNNRVSLASLGILVRGSSRRLTMDYRSPMHGRPPEIHAASTVGEEPTA